MMIFLEAFTSSSKAAKQRAPVDDWYKTEASEPKWISWL
jgi:hypothetical protein